jgi:predicted ArsR family transcriptional regulator
MNVLMKPTSAMIQHDVLVFLFNQNKPVCLREMARQFEHTFDQVRHVMDRLERRGIVERFYERKQQSMLVRHYRLLVSSLELASALLEKAHEMVGMDDEHEQWMNHYRQRFVRRYQRQNGCPPDFIVGSDPRSV